MIDKPKRGEKRKRNDTSRWEHFFDPLPFEFESSLPLENCVSLLRDRDNRGMWLAHQRVKVEIWQVNTDTYAFYIRRKKGRGAAQEATGQLQRWQDNRTLISGKAENRNLSQVLLMGVFGLFAVIFVGASSFESAVFVVLFFVGVIALNIWVMSYQGENFVRFIQDSV